MVIWQVWLQLNCCDNCEIWMWLKEFDWYFHEIENFAYREINKHSFNNPHPRSVSTLSQVMACCSWHQAITWTNVDLSFVSYSDNHLREILQEIPQSSYTEVSLKITCLNIYSDLQGPMNKPFSSGLFHWHKGNGMIPHVFKVFHMLSTHLEILHETTSIHYDDVIMTMLASQITSLAVVYSIVYSGVDQRKHQSPASLAFVREIHRGPVNFPQKWPVTRKIFPFDDVITLPSCLVPHNTNQMDVRDDQMYLAYR